MGYSPGTPLGVSIANFDRLRRSTEGMAVYLLGTFVRQMYDMAGEIPSVADLVRRTGAWGDHEAATRGVFRMLARDHPGVDVVLHRVVEVGERIVARHVVEVVRRGREVARVDRHAAERVP